MADVTLTSPSAKAADRLRTLLSESSAFRTWCGESTAPAALGHVHLGMLTETEIEALDWPYVQITDALPGSDEDDQEDEAVAAQTFARRYGLYLIVGNAVSGTHANDGRNAWASASNDVATLETILRAQNGLDVGTVRFVHGGVRRLQSQLFVPRAENAGTDRYVQFQHVLGLVIGLEPGE